MLEKAKEILLSTEYICNHCLGRQFGKLLSSSSNRERGEHIRYTVALTLDIEGSEIKTKNFLDFSFRKAKVLEKDKELCCILCKNLFEKLYEIVDKMIEKTKFYEFETFLVGIKLPKELIKKEEEFWENFGKDYAEPLKEELSREIGKLFAKKTFKKFDFLNPDISFLINLENFEISLNVRSLFIYGKYNKYKEMPQSKWEKYPETVEDLIAEVLLNKTKGEKTKFHGSGREDIDALCFGWREFVIEVVNPKIRSIDLSTLEREINQKYLGKIEVKDLKFSNKSEVREIKSKNSKKIYEVIIKFEDNIDEEKLKILKTLEGKKIKQLTPTRVLHRRKDKERIKKIYSISYEIINKNKIKAKIKADAGTYIKELVSGDNGRTTPSFSSLINMKATVEKLIVVGFED